MEWLEKIISRWKRKPYNPFPPPENQRERLSRLSSESAGARRVLESPEYNQAYQVLLARYADQILDTDPLDVDRVQHLHLKAHLLQEMARELASMVYAYEVELTRAKSSSESD